MAPAAVRSLIGELERIDHAVYEAVARTPTPRLDGTMRRLAAASDYSRLSLGAGCVLALAFGPQGRRAAGSGLVSLGATAGVVNAVVKLAGRRRRPNRDAAEVPEERHVPMPASRSFPSGHTASAVAFATGVGRVMPVAALPLHALAAVVGYSRVHTGVHYPGDVLAGSVLGAMITDLTLGLLRRGGRRAPSPPLRAR